MLLHGDSKKRMLLGRDVVACSPVNIGGSCSERRKPLGLANAMFYQPEVAGLSRSQEADAFWQIVI